MVRGRGSVMPRGLLERKVKREDMTKVSENTAIIFQILLISQALHLNSSNASASKVYVSLV